MLEFRSININDMNEAKKCLQKSDLRGCEYSFANNLAWSGLYRSTVCFYGGFYISKSEYGGTRFCFPSGEGDYSLVFSEMRKYAEHNGFSFELFGVGEKGLEILSELYPDEFTFEEDIDGEDYIYNADDLKYLKGSKYHKKRNHLKKIENYKYEYTALTEKDFGDCITFAAKHYIAGGSFGDSEIGEQYAINTFFEHFGRLGLTGGVLRIDGEVAAFTIGEKLNSDTVDIHIEKADKNIEGAYQAINNFYALSQPEDVLYINREEDMGLEGLRRSKRSYYPAFMQRKFIVKFK